MRLKGWQRIGIVATARWMIGDGCGSIPDASAGADEMASAVQFVRVTFWAVPVQLHFPLHYVASAPVLLDQLGDAVAALALAA